MGAETNILQKLFTEADRPTMEYATKSKATASNGNKSKLDSVQNIALRAVAVAMKTTPIKEMEKRVDLEPSELRRIFTVLAQMHADLVTTWSSTPQLAGFTNQKSAKQTEPRPFARGPQNTRRYPGPADQ